MESTVNRFIYGWFVVMLGLTAISGAFMLASPSLFIAIQRRLVKLTGVPEEVFEPFWTRVPLRLVGAFQLVASVGFLYFLLIVDPDFLNH